MTNNGGRPTKYEDSFIGEIDKYLATTGREQTKLPTMQGLALHLNVNKDTLYAWKKHHPEFSVSLDRLLDTQAQQLIDDGIYGGKEVNSTIVKLLLQNNHGMREKTDIAMDIKEIIIGRDPVKEIE